MEWLIISFFLETGIFATNQELFLDSYYDYRIYNVSNSLYTDIGIELKAFDILVINGSSFIMMQQKRGVFLDPFQADFMIGIAVQRGPVTIGYEHLCKHPFTAPPDLDLPTPKYGGYDKLYIRFEGVLK